MKKIVNKLEEYIIYAIMILAFLMYSSATQNTILISGLIWPIVVLSMICIIVRIFNYNNYKINMFHKLLLAFIISYIISLLLNISYGYYQNLRTLVLMLIIIGIVYTKKKDDNTKNNLIQKYSKFFIIITTCLSFASLLIFNINQVYINIGNENIYITGLRWGRLKGFYNDFNYGGIINVMAITMSIYFLYVNKNKKTILLNIISILINFSFIALSDSRSSLIAMILSIAIFYSICNISKKQKTIKKIIKNLIVISIIVFIMLLGKVGIKKVYSYIYDNQEEKIIINIKNGIDIKTEINKEITNSGVIKRYIDCKMANKKQEISQNNTEKTIAIVAVNNLDGINVSTEGNIVSIEDEKDISEIDIFNRGYSKNEDISNRRFDLWKSAIEIFKKSPIYGVSFENVESYCYRNLPDTYLINNDYRVFDNFHNLIFNVLASQGIIGIVILGMIVIYLIINIIRYIIHKVKQMNFSKEDALIISCIVVGFISTLFIGDIVYYISPSTITFWFLIGYLINDIDNSENKRQSKLNRAIRKGCRILLVKFFNLFPISNKKIILDNFNGKGYGDNSKYIVEEINKRNLGYDLVWILKNKKDARTLPDNVRYVKYNSIKYFYDICTAKIWVDNHRKIIDLDKRKKQYYIQTWHGGIALKKIEKDAQDVLEPKYIEQAKHDSEMIDLMVSNSRFCTNMYKTAFWYNGEILECGSPRNDILIKGMGYNKDEILNKIGINSNKKILLYAPTFRKDEGLDNYNINFETLVQNLNEKTNEDCIVLLRLHPNIAYKSKELYNGEFGEVLDVSDYGDIYELMLVSDILITDYSSVMFEFSITGKPVFLYAKDIDNYINDRGFYFDYYKLPYKLSVNDKELLENILNFDYNEYKNKLEEFFAEVELYEKGIACEKVVDIIESKINGE